MSRSKPTKPKQVFFLIIALYFSFSPSIVFAELKPTSSSDCVDLLLVFNRGSGQNLNHELIQDPLNPDFQALEKESYNFFSWFKYHLQNEYPHIDYKAVSIHDFPGKYSPVGYKAVPIGVPGQVANTANAEMSWIPGDYRNSVEQGTIETVGYLKDQIANCPNQSIVVGGYSQGAQVMGDSLFQLTPQERSKILGVGLFGDPKFIASTGDNLLNPFDHAISYPWRRGDATNNDRGMLDARTPYAPSDIEKRVASYCFESDLVCAGWSGARGIKDVAHGGYAAEPMRNTINEIVHWAAPNLAAYERAHGGLSSEGGDPTILRPDNNPRDIMFVFNDDSNLSTIQTLRYSFDPTVWPLINLFPDTRLGAKSFGESESSGQTEPRVENIQALLSYTGYAPNNPSLTASNIARAINKNYPFGQPHYGSGDSADPYQLALEHAIFSGGWQDDRQKNIVLIVDRPPKDNYRYNICNSTVRHQLSVADQDTYTHCVSNPDIETFQKVLSPEMCETAYQVITLDQCTVDHTGAPGALYHTRTLDDTIAEAQSQHTAISVVIPFKAQSGNDLSKDTTRQQLKYIAQATGGVYIYYDQRTQYSSALLSDTLSQVLMNKPKSLVLAYKEALDGQENFNKGHVLSVSTNQPVILDVSQSNQSYDEYKWDFNNDGQWDETTPGPVTQHEFTTPQTGFIRAMGISSDDSQAETRIAVAANDTNEEPTQPTPPTVPEVTALEQSNGDITLSWQTDQDGYLLAIDPESNLPVAQAPLSDGMFTFTPEKPYTELKIRVVSDDVISDAQTITITPVPEQTKNDTPATATEQPDPTICYKLQQCQGESTWENVYNLQSTPAPGEETGPTVQTIAVDSHQNTTGPNITTESPPSVEGISTNPTISDQSTTTAVSTVENDSKNNYLPWLVALFLIFCMGAVYLRFNKKPIS